MTEAIEALRAYVASDFDGGVAACFRLDELLWEVRRSHPHSGANAPTEPAGCQVLLEVPVLLEDLDLEELGL